MAIIVDYGTVVNLSGTAIPLGSYTAPASPFTDAAAQAVALFVTIKFDAATALTDMRVKLQALDNAVGAAWFDVATVRATTGDVGTTTASEHVFAAAAGATLSDALMTTSAFMVKGGIRAVVEATGAGPLKAGDSVVISLKASES